MSDKPRAFNQFRLIASIAGLLVFLWLALFKVALHSLGTRDLAILACFFLFIFFAELLPVKFPRSGDEELEFTMTMPVIIGFFLSRGPAEAIFVSAVSFFIANIFTHRDRPLRWTVGMVSFNTATFILSVAGASLVYLLIGGTTLAQHGSITSAQSITALAVWVFVCTTLNMVLLSIGVSLLLTEPLRMHLLQNLRWYFPNYVVTMPSGILFAVMYEEFNVLGIVLVILPFLVGRQALHLYAAETDMYRETITTLGTYMQHYHPYTKGHLERVAELADRIAKEIGLLPQSLMLIRNAGLLHDIGKVGVGDEILDKVGKLSDEDWSTIKQHPARGAEILDQMNYLERIVPWVRGHHERPDGRGYPDGLKAEQIPLEAAVIAVADAFDAMTGGPEDKDQRVYRPPLSLDQAMDQVRLGTGTQFDARVVKAFMRVMAEEEGGNGE